MEDKLMKNAFFIFFITMVLSTNVFAKENSFFEDDSSIELKFGGWSKHDSDKLGYMDVPLNENHRGFGVEYYQSISKNNKHWLGLGTWYMKDSFDGDSFQVSVAYKYTIPINYIIDSVEFNVNAGIINRTYREMFYNNYGGYREFIGYDEYRATKAIVSPMVTLNFLDHLQLDFTYFPDKLAEHFTGNYELFFFRVGYKI
tara:strand:+ start:98798 stop:99397 length:600 start_codon:yes stop_codon:yes gene_type:complete